MSIGATSNVSVSSVSAMWIDVISIESMTESTLRRSPDAMSMSTTSPTGAVTVIGAGSHRLAALHSSVVGTLGPRSGHIGIIGFAEPHGTEARRAGAVESSRKVVGM